MQQFITCTNKITIIAQKLRQNGSKLLKGFTLHIGGILLPKICYKMGEP